MLTHLYTNYANISSPELALNDDAMKKDYDVSLPIESLFDYIDAVVGYATAGGGGHHTPQKKITIYFQLVFNTGLFPDNYKIWKRRLPINKTYA